MSDDTIRYLRPKGDPLVPMSQEMWGQELVKTYLMSVLEIHQDLVDGRVSSYTDAQLQFVAGVALHAIEEAIRIIDSGELEQKLAEKENDD